MRRSVALLLAASSLAFAPAPFSRPERRAAAVNELIGEWAHPGSPNQAYLVITHDRIEYGSPVNVYALKVDLRALPRTYDITGVSPGNQNAEFRGIYKVEGDRLTLNYNSGTTNRPTSFEQNGRGQSYEVYVRRSRP